MREYYKVKKEYNEKNGTNVNNGTKGLTIASQDEIWFVYFFLGFTIGLHSFNFNDFWSEGNIVSTSYLIVSVLFIFTPLWRRVYRTHMADKAKMRRKYAIYYYIFFYSLQLLYLIRQIGYLIKTHL